MQRSLVAVWCLAVLSLAACTTDPSSSADPPPSPPATSTPSVSVTPQVRETPEAFVRRWVDADTHMQNTGDGDDYRAMSVRCPNCLKYADYIEGIWKAGGYVKTKGWFIDAAHSSKRLSGGHFDVTVDVTSHAVEYREKSGGPVGHYDASKSTYVISVSPRAQEWVVTYFAQVAQ